MRRHFAGYCAFGIGLWISLQSFVSIGVNLGLLPTKGLTLPLISSGGSSVLMTCAAFGLLLRVSATNSIAPSAARSRACAASAQRVGRRAGGIRERRCRRRSRRARPSGAARGTSRLRQRVEPTLASRTALRSAAMTAPTPTCIR